MTVNYKLKSPSGRDILLKPPNDFKPIDAVRVPTIRCPHCMHMGAFNRVVAQDLSVHHIQGINNAPVSRGYTFIGIRSCPNPECRGVVFAIMDKDSSTICLPGEVLDFDASDIPAPIAASLEEAIKCHAAQCYKAAALMVRRTLEEMCEDQQASGSSLKDRLSALSKIIVVPKELLQAADQLRLLGNDAAHIEAKTYESIGETELRVAIDLTKELLKATYQYKGLLGRLTALKKPSA